MERWLKKNNNQAQNKKWGGDTYKSFNQTRREKKKSLKKVTILIVLIYGLFSAAIAENTDDIYFCYDGRDWSSISGGTAAELDSLLMHLLACFIYRSQVSILFLYPVLAIALNIDK